MRVRQLMSGEVRSTRAEQALSEAAAVMLEQGFSGLPVVDEEERLIGVVTELHIIRSCTPAYLLDMRDFDFLPGDIGVLERVAKDFGRRNVGEVMTAEGLFTVEEDDAAAEVGVEMVKHGFTLVPVVREGKLVGVVTRADIVRALVQLAEERPAS